MFSKVWEVSKIFTRAERGDISPIDTESWWKFCFVLLRVVLTQVLLLAIWMGTTPPRSETVITDPIELIGYHRCVYNPYSAFYLSFYVVILGWGGYLAYETRDIWVKYHYPNESKAILMSIYNFGFCASILLPLALVAGVNQEVVLFLVSLFLMFPTTFALAVVYGPKVVHFLGASKQSKSRGGGSFPTAKMGSENGKFIDRGEKKAKDEEILDGCPKTTETEDVLEGSARTENRTGPPPEAVPRLSSNGWHLLRPAPASPVSAMPEDGSPQISPQHAANPTTTFGLNDSVQEDEEEGTVV